MVPRSFPNEIPGDRFPDRIGEFRVVRVPGGGLCRQVVPRTLRASQHRSLERHHDRHPVAKRTTERKRCRSARSTSSDEQARQAERARSAPLRSAVFSVSPAIRSMTSTPKSGQYQYAPSQPREQIFVGMPATRTENRSDVPDRSTDGPSTSMLAHFLHRSIRGIATPRTRPTTARTILPCHASVPSPATACVCKH